MSLSVKHVLRGIPALQHAVRGTRQRAQEVLLHATERLISTWTSYEILVVFGMRRSGNHLSISWILEQVDGSSVFYNNINPDLHPFTGKMTEVRMRAVNPAPRIVLSYEDVNTDRLLSPQLLDFLDGRVSQHGAKVRFALILRDPYNLFASRMTKWPERFAGEADIAAQQMLYTEHASLATAPAPIWRDAPLVPVLYNSLVTDPEARCRTAAALGIRNGTRGLDTVPVYGNGSSFDGLGVSGTEMREQVFSRWQAKAADPQFRRVIDTPDIERAAITLFGMNPPDQTP